MPLSHALSLYSLRAEDTLPVGCTCAGTFLPLIDLFQRTWTGSPSLGKSGEAGPMIAASLRDGFQEPRSQASMLKRVSSPDSCTRVPKPFSWEKDLICQWVGICSGDRVSGMDDEYEIQ